MKLTKIALKHLIKEEAKNLLIEEFCITTYLIRKLK